MTHIDELRLLRDAIHWSGLSARRYAREVLLRDERTVRRWLAGDSPIPETVLEFLRAIKRPPGMQPPRRESK